MVGRLKRLALGLKPSSRVVLESALIVFSVLLGFAVTEWRERIAEKHLASTVLTNVVAEVEQNLTGLTSQIEKHQRMIASLKAIDLAAAKGTGWDVAISAMGGGLNALPMREAAWQAAVSSGALRFIDYDVAAALSDIYTTQIDVYGHNAAVSSSSLFVPDSFRAASRDETIQLFLWSLINLEGNERFLKAVYERNLPGLQRRADRDK
jgi:hypothetical protein